MTHAQWYPGHYQRPIDYSQHNQCDELTAFTAHEAVTTEEQTVFGWVSTEGSCNWFNGRYGYSEQYIPCGTESYANSYGNHRSFAMESYDGLILTTELNAAGQGANETTWDAGQLEKMADVLAWLNLEWGVPIRLMLSSHSAEHGIGPHRLGVPGFPYYDNLGGELWTSHPGKLCPGDLRVAQLPGVVARAQVIADAIKAGKCTYLPPGKVDLVAAKARTGGVTGGGITTPTIPAPFDPIGFLMSLPGAPATWAAAKKEIVDAITAAMAAPFPTDGSQTLGTATQAVVNNVHAQGSVINPKTGERNDFGHMNVAVGLIAEKVGVQPA